MNADKNICANLYFTTVVICAKGGGERDGDYQKGFR